MIEPAMIEAWAALGGVAVAAIGLVLVILQLRGLEQSVRSAAHSAVYVQASDFRGHLVTYPELRKYFFDGAAIEPGHEHYDRVMTIAELYLNELEQITETMDSLGRSRKPVFDRFIRTALEKSPVMRRRLAEGADFYSPMLAAYLGGPPRAAVR